MEKTWTNLLNFHVLKLNYKSTEVINQEKKNAKKKQL